MSLKPWVGWYAPLTGEHASEHLLFFGRLCQEHLGPRVKTNCRSEDLSMFTERKK